VTTPANILVAEPKIYVDPTYSHVPEAMKQVDRWLAFLITWNPETEHFDKTPLNSKGNVANDHQGGESFATMLEYTRRNPKTVLGFYVRPPFIAIDLDGGVNMEIKDIAPWISQVIREVGSYAELSPSGTGIHIIGLGTKPGNKSKIGSVEIYTDKRALI
jgi:putative DNA primase/helicase